MKHQSIYIISISLGVLVGMAACTSAIKNPGPEQPAVAALEKKIKPRAYAQLTPLKIDDVSVLPGIFNPGNDEKLNISFRLSRPGAATVRFFDVEMGQVAEIEAKEESAGSWKATWDGRDSQGKLVPDSAYFFTVTARDHQRNQVIYDPTEFSGGAAFLPSDLVFNPEKKQVAFSLHTSAWVRMRAGIPKGPLLANIQNWIPYSAGEHRLDWDGTDQTGIFMISNQPVWKLMTGAVTLPENSIITEGNTQYDYLAYKASMAPNWRWKTPPSSGQLPHLQTREKIRFAPVPDFKMDLPGATPLRQNGLHVVNGNVPIKIELDNRIKRYALEQRYEIMIFVDFQFVSEEDEGYSPATRIWDSRSVPDGEHVITANVRILGGNVQGASMRVVVRNDAP